MLCEVVPEGEVRAARVGGAFSQAVIHDSRQAQGDSLKGKPSLTLSSLLHAVGHFWVRPSQDNPRAGSSSSQSFRA